MLFPSFEFLFYFLPLLLLSYHAMPNRGRRALLAIASYFFYGWWDYRFIGLLWLSTVIDYLAGGAIHRTDDPRRRKRWLIVSVIANLGVLGFFKYFAFANRSLAAMFELLGAGYPRALLDVHVILPIGISFFTFQSMSYTIDIYRRKVRPAASFVDFACYISLFPQLIAGPIVRYSMMEDQLRRPEISTGRFYLGMQFFHHRSGQEGAAGRPSRAAGRSLFRCAESACLRTPDAVLAVLAYSCRFISTFPVIRTWPSAWAIFLGYGFPKNFDSPYKALSFANFGAAGTSPSRPGCAIISTFPWAVRGAGAGRPTATCC
jgi:alginate O-acetyltransferase complex protein AlgI